MTNNIQTSDSVTMKDNVCDGITFVHRVYNFFNIIVKFGTVFAYKDCINK